MADEPPPKSIPMSSSPTTKRFLLGLATNLAVMAIAFGVRQIAARFPLGEEPGLDRPSVLVFGHESARASPQPVVEDRQEDGHWVARVWLEERPSAGRVAAEK